MPAQHLILAHDLGTTGNKATLFREDGSVFAATFVPYPTAYPSPNWAEQNPQHWRDAVFGATRTLLQESGAQPRHIVAISFSGHMNGAVFLADDGQPLRPAIIWADQRATAEAAELSRACGEERVYQLTGNRVSAAYTAAKMLWVKNHQPEIWARTAKVIQAKDYAAFLFSGVIATDYSDASLTALLDINTRQWASILLDYLSLSAEVLPPIYPSATTLGGVTAAAAEATGLAMGTPVVIGGGDGACATVGAGAVAMGDVYNYLGSSSWIGLTSEQPVLDPQQRTFNILHLDPRYAVAIGAMQAAGGAFDWFERLLRAQEASGPAYEALSEAASTVPVGSGGLLFLPYLLGERSPHWNPLARGAFVGLAMSHGRGEMARAVMEGVAFNLRNILDILRSQGVKVSQMRLIGGGEKSAVWRRILADVYRLPVARLSFAAEATSLGAAIAGGVGVGLFADYSVARKLAPIVEHDYPNPEHSQRYEELYTLFCDTYQALEPIFNRLAPFSSVSKIE